MNNWLEHWDQRYTDRVQLLVQILPALAQEPHFALKGGTAINLFEHDLPRVPVDFVTTYEAHFKGMTAKPIEAEVLMGIHERLLARVAGWLDEPSCAFLRSIENERPDFDLIGLPHSVDLPAVRRKLYNLAQRTDVKRAADRDLLEETLARVVAAR